MLEHARAAEAGWTWDRECSGLRGGSGRIAAVGAAKLLLNRQDVPNACKCVAVFGSRLGNRVVALKKRNVSRKTSRIRAAFMHGPFEPTAD